MTASQLLTLAVVAVAGITALLAIVLALTEAMLPPGYRAFIRKLQITNVVFMVSACLVLWIIA